MCRGALGLRSVFPIFLCDIPHISMAIILSVSLTPACPCLEFTIGCSSLDAWLDEWLGWLSVPLLALPGLLSFALTYSPDSVILMHPAIDIVWRCPCLPHLRLLWPLAIAVRLVVFHPCWLLTLSLTGSWVWAILQWALAVLEAGWRTVPSSHFQDSVNMPDRLSMQ